MNISATSSIRLFNSIMESDIPRFIRMASQELGYPCCYISSGLSEVYLSSGACTENDLLWESLFRSRRNPEQMIPQFCDATGLRMMILQSVKGEPDRFEKADSEYLHFFSAIKSEGYITGFTDLLCRKNGNRDEAKSAAAVLSGGVAMIEKSNNAGYWKERKEKTSLLGKTLLEHSFTSWNEYRILSGLTEDRLPGRYAVMCVSHGDNTKIPLDDKYCGPVLRAVYEDVLPCEMNGNLYYLLNRLHSEKQLRTIYSQFSMRIMEKHRIGISALYEDPEDSEIYREQAELACSFLGSNDSGESLCSYPENRREILRSIPRQNGDAAAWKLPAIREMRRLDRVNGTEYFRTLYSYMALFCDKQETARRLAIHRNTLNYRLQRIQEICGLDLTDPQTLRMLFIGGYLMMDDIDIPI